MLMLILWLWVAAALAITTALGAVAVTGVLCRSLMALWRGAQGAPEARTAGTEPAVRDGVLSR